MPGDLRIRGSVVVPEAELSWRFSRSSGPGGQGVNTTDSRVELSLDVATTSALSPYLRARALERLADLLATAIAPPPRPRVPTKPSASARRRRVDDKKHRGKIKKLRRGGPD